MFFDIDPSNGVAIYEQIVRQVSFAVAGQALRPGEPVPSVRQLARQLAMNPNTVARAYRRLQDEHVLDSIRGTGLVVAAGAAKRCRQMRNHVIRERLRHVLAEARQGRLTDEEIQTLIRQELATLPTPPDNDHHQS
jgi:GntR family transcriptional regulator